MLATQCSTFYPPKVRRGVGFDRSHHVQLSSNFWGKKHGQKVGIKQNPTFLPTFWQKKAGRKLDGFHITGNPPLSQDQNGCLTFMRQPLSIFYLYYQVAEVAAGG